MSALKDIYIAAREAGYTLVRDDEEMAERLRQDGWTVYKPFTPTEIFENNINRAVADLSLAIAARQDGAEMTETAQTMLGNLSYRVAKLLIGEIPDAE